MPIIRKSALSTFRLRSSRAGERPQDRKLEARERVEQRRQRLRKIRRTR